MAYQVGDTKEEDGRTYELVEKEPINPENVEFSHVIRIGDTYIRGIEGSKNFFQTIRVDADTELPLKSGAEMDVSFFYSLKNMDGEIETVDFEDSPFAEKHCYWKYQYE